MYQYTQGKGSNFKAIIMAAKEVGIRRRHAWEGEPQFNSIQNIYLPEGRDIKFRTLENLITNAMVQPPVLTVKQQTGRVLLPGVSSS